ncbi:MAG: class I SAM-dependent methyltransferase [Pseudolabrys sp.]
MLDRPAFPVLSELMGADVPVSGSFTLAGRQFVVRDGILRAEEFVSPTQSQTADVFGYKWNRRGTFDSENARSVMRTWLYERYGKPDEMPWLKDGVLVLDVGCGAALSAGELFGERLKTLRYVGTDISNALDVAAEKFRDEGWNGEFLQCDLNALPFRAASCDVVFSEGVLHHTDSTEKAFHTVAKLVKPGGHFLFYVYRKKGPIREFTDDYVRAKLRALPPEKAWDAIVPLTKLGIALGKLKVDITVEEDVDLLGIKAGTYDIQRFFYWNVAKAVYRDDLTLDEMAHVNFDWFAPLNAHRHTEQDVRGWCAAADFTIEREVIQESGITVIARRAEG